MDTLKEEFEFYLANQDSMVEQYDGRVIVIKRCEVIGEYDSELDAFTKTVEHHERGTFMIQRVSAGSKDYTATFHSPRVVLP